MGRLTELDPSLILTFMSELERIVTKRPKISIPDEWDVTIKRLSNETRISEAELYRMAIRLLFESYDIKVEGEVKHGGKRIPHDRADESDKP